ncbi:Putative amidase domain-containing protein [Arthrobacter sp. 31Cvi3.1E]|nr:Putative amidase domain-containing protein [Arthrobacter sp. 31Cvi3.1E]
MSNTSLFPTTASPLSRRLLLGASFATLGSLALGNSANAAPVSSGKFDRTKAVSWAKSHINRDQVFGNDCAYFVSRALWEGGLPKSVRWDDHTVNPWDMGDKDNHPFGPTKAAASSDILKNYLQDRSFGVLRELNFKQNNVPDAQLGDVIFYDWDHGADGFVDHTMIITGFSKDSNNKYRYPLVSGHSRPTDDQGWTWSRYKDGWIEEKYREMKNGSPNQARAYLLHVTY